MIVSVPTSPPAVATASPGGPAERGASVDFDATLDRAMVDRGQDQGQVDEEVTAAIEESAADTDSAALGAETEEQYADEPESPAAPSAPHAGPEVGLPEVGLPEVGLPEEGGLPEAPAAVADDATGATTPDPDADRVGAPVPADAPDTTIVAAEPDATETPAGTTTEAWSVPVDGAPPPDQQTPDADSPAMAVVVAPGTPPESPGPAQTAGPDRPTVRAAPATPAVPATPATSSGVAAESRAVTPSAPATADSAAPAAETSSATSAAAAPAAPAAPATPATPAAPATSAGASSAPTPPPVAEQIVTHVTPLLDGPDGSHELRIELQPAELGTLRLEVRVEDGRVHVRFHADDPAARRLLAESMGDLRQSFDASGLRAGDLDVDHRRASERDGGSAQPGDAAADGDDVVPASRGARRRVVASTRSLDVLL